MSIGDIYKDSEGNHFKITEQHSGFIWLRNNKGDLKQIDKEELKFYFLVKKVKFVIKFRDGDEVHHYREPIIEKDGCWYGDVGDIIEFETREEAKKYLDTLDSREFERWVEEV